MYLSRLGSVKGLPSVKPSNNVFLNTQNKFQTKRANLLSPIPTSHKRFLATEPKFNSNHGHGHSSYGPNRKGFKFGTFLIGLSVGTAFVYGTVVAAGLFVNEEKDTYDPNAKRQKIVILGSGWGGLGAAKEIDTNRYDVTMISPRDHFLFTPLLTDATFGDVDPTTISEPIRALLQRWNPRVKYVDAVCSEINTDTQSLKCKAGTQTFEVTYDKLVVAVGSTVNTYGIKGVKENCLFLKEAKDTSLIKNKLMDLFESANIPGKTEQQLKDMLHFVVVGNGAHSIQFITTFKDLLDNELKSLYPHLIGKSKLTYVDWKDPKNTYDSKITSYFHKNVLKPVAKQLNIIKSNIKEVNTSHIILENSEKIPYGACIWITGNTPLPLIYSLPELQTNKNALLTNQFLQVYGYDNIYAVGECATVAQSYLMHKWAEIFDLLDEDKSGTIDSSEFKAFVPVFSREYPQLLEFAKQAEALFEKFDVNKDKQLSRDEFQKVLEAVDASVTALPSTANMAVQQGRYLGVSLNMTLHENDLRVMFRELDEDKSGFLDIKELRKGLRKLGIPASRKEIEEMMKALDANNDQKVDEEEFISFALNHQQQSGTGDWKKLSHFKILPFRYKHLGGYEYVGYENKITFRGSPGTNILDGFGAWWLWNSIFASKLIGARIRSEIVINYLTRRVFGRNLTRN